MSGVCLTDIESADDSDGGTLANTQANSQPPKKRRYDSGDKFGLSSTLKNSTIPTEKRTFRLPENSDLETIFRSTRKESNIQRQRRMMADSFGSANDLPSTSDMTLEALTYSRQLGIRPYHIPIMGRSIARVKDTPATIARRSINLNSVSTGGKLKINNESIEEIVCNEVDLKAVFSLMESGLFNEARDWLATLQKTATIPPSTNEEFVTWLLQLYTESFAIHHIHGKIATALTALSKQIENEELREKIVQLLKVETSGFDIMRQHSECLMVLKSAIKHQADPSAFRGFREKLRKRAQEYRLKTSDKHDSLSHYQDIMLSYDETDSRLEKNKQLFNQRRRKRTRERNAERERKRNPNPRDRRPRPDPKNLDGKRNYRNQDLANKTCWTCGNKGHTSATCSKSVCQYCQKKGHTISVCRKRKRDEADAAKKDDGKPTAHRV